VIYIYRKGQFALLAALFIALMLVVVVFNVYQTRIYYRRFSGKKYAEIVKAISSDFRRVVTRALAMATHEYSITNDFATARLHAQQFVSNWIKTIMYVYEDYGPQIKVVIKKIRYSQWDIDNLVKGYWYVPSSISAAYAVLSLNLTKVGFYGWRQSVRVALEMRIDPSSFINTQYLGVNVTMFNISLRIDMEKPFINLREDQIRILYQDPRNWGWYNATILKLIYHGNGTYTVIITPQVPLLNGRARVHVLLEDDRQITVEGYNWNYIDYIIQDNACLKDEYGNIVRCVAPYKSYVLEVLQNGTFYWYYDWKLPNHASIPLPPLPPIPIKQFRVWISEHGPDSDLVMVPIQFERWDNNFQVFKGLANLYRRFSDYHKLVFQVNFTDSRRKKVRIGWISDIDAQPYPIRVKLNYSGDYIVAYNGYYYLQLVASEGKSYAIDWSISLISPDPLGGYYSVEYMLGGYDVLRTSCGWWWIPRKLAGGTWYNYSGAVRGFAFRHSRRTIEVVENTSCTDLGYIIHTDEMENNMVVTLPYAAHYVMLRINYTYLKDIVVSNHYINLITMISGSANDTNSPKRLWYWYYTDDPDGEFTIGQYSSSYHRHINDDDFGGNETLYCGQSRKRVNDVNEEFVHTIYMNPDFYSLLNKKGERALVIWTSADYARRVEELLVSRFISSSPIAISAGEQYFFKVALFTFAGDITRDDLKLYGLMFYNESYIPSIEDIILP